jgi:hypothetical protein
MLSFTSVSCLFFNVPFSQNNFRIFGASQTWHSLGPQKVKVRTWSQSFQFDDVREQGDDNIWTEERGSNRRCRKLHIRKIEQRNSRISWFSCPRVHTGQRLVAVSSCFHGTCLRQRLDSVCAGGPRAQDFHLFIYPIITGYCNAHYTRSYCSNSW